MNSRMFAHCFIHFKTIVLRPKRIFHLLGHFYFDLNKNISRGASNITIKIQWYVEKGYVKLY